MRQRAVTCTECALRVKGVAATLAAAPREQQAAVGPGIVDEQQCLAALAFVVQR
jgi:hypothetical protein